MASNDDTPSTQRNNRKERFEDDCGYWHPAFDYLLALDPDYVESYREFASHPRENGPLDEKTRSLVMLAFHSSMTHVHGPSIRMHINQAFDAGASVEEVLDVFKLVSVVGSHGTYTGVEAFSEVTSLPELDPEEERRIEEKKVEYKAERGYWSPIFDDLMHLDDEFFERYSDYFGRTRQRSNLSAKVQEFVYMAIDTNATHMYDKGLTIHIERALEEGASKAEVMEVLELSCLMGVSTMLESVPILVEEAADRGKLSGSMADTD
jgi:alkylhydroperoxidase/carboxymuconolactone decarboxylase family protein YurZ